MGCSAFELNGLGRIKEEIGELLEKCQRARCRTDRDIKRKGWVKLANASQRNIPGLSLQNIDGDGCDRACGLETCYKDWTENNDSSSRHHDHTE